MIRLPRGTRLRFDQLFGRKHFTLKCMLRSFFFSFVSLALLFVLAKLHGAMSLSVFWSIVSGETRSKLYSNQVRILFIMLFAWSFVADYLSLLKTRVVLYWLDAHSIKRNIVLLPLLTGDFCFSAIVFAAGVAVLTPASVIMSAIGVHYPSVVFGFVFEMFWKIIIVLFTELPGMLVHPLQKPLQYSLPFYASLVPSIWLWTWVLTTFAMRIVSHCGPLFRFVSYVLPIAQHPIRTLGILAGSISGIIYGIVAALFT